MLVTLSYYKNVFRAGITQVVTDLEFPFYEKQAERELGRHTFGLLSSVVVSEAGVATVVVNTTTYTLVLADIQDCICEIAEYLCLCAKSYNAAQGGNLTSYSNDGDSGSVDKSMFSEASKKQKIRTIAKTYLSGTILLHAGVDLSLGGDYCECCES